MTDMNKPTGQDRDLAGLLSGLITLDHEFPAPPVWESPASRSNPPFTWDGTIQTWKAE